MSVIVEAERAKPVNYPGYMREEDVNAAVRGADYRELEARSGQASTADAKGRQAGEGEMRKSGTERGNAEGPGVESTAWAFDTRPAARSG